MKKIARASLVSTALVLACLLSTTIANAQEDVATAKAEFTKGVELTRQEKWGEALEAFEAAGRAKKHALSTYNAAVAERALSRYTRARIRFAQALEEDAASGNKDLAQNYRDDAKTFLAELDALLVHLEVTLDPSDASLMIDGRPLQWVSEERKVAYAGVANAGVGEKVDRKAFEVIVDPGLHVFTVAKEGFDTVVRRDDVKAGAHVKVALSLTAMPGKMKIDANQNGAVVRVNEIDVGVAPLTIERPSGDYRVELKKKGFVDYATNIKLLAGQRTDLFAKMNEDTPLTKRWWFWSAIGGAIVAGAVTGFVIVNGQRDPDGGTTGWVAHSR